MVRPRISDLPFEAMWLGEHVVGSPGVRSVVGVGFVAKSVRSIVDPYHLRGMGGSLDVHVEGGEAAPPNHPRLQRSRSTVARLVDHPPADLWSPSVGGVRMLIPHPIPGSDLDI